MGLKQRYFPTVASIWTTEGFLGFYRGCIPPFFGSVIYRSTQFSVFEAFYTKWGSNEDMCKEVPGMFGVEYRTIAAGFLGGSARSCIECPFEYAKVKG